VAKLTKCRPIFPQGQWDICANLEKRWGRWGKKAAKKEDRKGATGALRPGRGEATEGIQNQIKLRNQTLPNKKATAFPPKFRQNLNESRKNIKRDNERGGRQSA
jgi:hypothetical protein